MRVLLPGSTGLPPCSELTADDLVRAYSTPGGRWVRCNMVSTLDGAANGEDGRTGSINTGADHVVFDLLRALSDVVVIGAGTVRTEGYSALTVPPEWQATRAALGLAPTLPLVIATRSGDVPPTVRNSDRGRIMLATVESAPGLEEARAALGPEHVLVCGDDEVDIGRLLHLLESRGLEQVLTEGGPSLLGSFLTADVLDELCFTIVPRLVGGEYRRPVGPEAGPRDLALGLLLEEAGTLLGRWFTAR